MIKIKTAEEIKFIKAGGKKLSKILGEIVKFVRVGMGTEGIDKLAERLIYKAGGEPAFRGYEIPGSPPFPSVLCISINNEVVHAPATPNRILKDGDIVGLDIGMKWPKPGIRNNELGIRGFYTDTAVTIGVGKVSKEARKLMKITRESLVRGLRVIKPGNSISDIGREVQEYVKKFDYGIVRALVGHGVGYEVHEEPPIPNYYDARMPKIEIKEGMVLAIEPMITLGKGDIKLMPDKWTIVTHDGSLAAHFEVTVIVTRKGYDIATPLP